MKKQLKNFVSIFLVITLIPLSSFLFRGDTQSYFTVFDSAKNKEVRLTEWEYVIGALASEMPPTFHKEALKAQAVAIFTNALRNKTAKSEYDAFVNTEKNEGYIDSKTLKEMWGSKYEVYYEKMCSAVDATLSLVISHDGKLITAAYHALSSGKTESAENVWGQKVSYLVSVDSEGDTFCSEHTSKKTISVEKIRSIFEEKYPEIFLPVDDKLIFTDFVYSDSESVLSVTVGNIKLSGQKIRELFSLRSAAFTTSLDKENFIFSCNGYGHGVGLSQYGADFLARQGSDFKQILCHYYKNCDVMRAAM